MIHIQCYIFLAIKIFVTNMVIVTITDFVFFEIYKVSQFYKLDVLKCYPLLKIGKPG